MSKAALSALSALTIAASMAFAGAAFAGQKSDNGANNKTPAPTQQTSTTPSVRKSGGSSSSSGKPYLRYKFGTVFTTK
jgi:hypothetical protein